jgi:hypothetical protein
MAVKIGDAFTRTRQGTGHLRKQTRLRGAGIDLVVEPVSEQTGGTRSE